MVPVVAIPTVAAVTTASSPSRSDAERPVSATAPGTVHGKPSGTTTRAPSVSASAIRSSTSPASHRTTVAR